MLVVRSDRHRGHHGLELTSGTLIPSWESPERATKIEAALRTSRDDQASFGPEIEPGPLDRSLVESVHSARYVDFLESAWSRWVAAGYTSPGAMGFAWPGQSARRIRPDDLVGQLGFHSFAADCSIGEGTWAAVESSAAIAQTAADRVANGEPAAFALCRPPGHHAGVEQFGGYCYLNNAAIAAQRLLARGSNRVAVLDIDYHHGNGTQEIFWNRNDVLVCSIHADPRHEFPWFSGHADEIGEGVGEGSTLNLPLERGADVTQWMTALEVGLDWLSHSSIESLVVSLGVDTYVDDPISQFKLAVEDFAEVGNAIGKLGIRTVFVMEGGYATDALGRNVATLLGAADLAIQGAANQD